MGINIQLFDVKIGEVSDKLDAALKKAVTKKTPAAEQAMMEHAVAYAKTVIDKVAAPSDSEVYIAINGEAGNTEDGTQNWLNIAVTETVRGTATEEKVAPIEEGASSPWTPPVPDPPPLMYQSEAIQRSPFDASPDVFSPTPEAHEPP